MAQVRLLTGRFTKVDGQVIQTFDLAYQVFATGPITSVPRLMGTNGCWLEIGVFSPRL